ncbi:hypothetical protein Glove_26g7 [Diversispora epigaea]|uniref:Uncharacterized protein n=1 Tax=Diversispora epigaea TaxID=1348612 RepID=A0A397JJI4_9GLOM|nr:hypothetical protein Glove_26g7 [Diversispora epigaea]
MLNKCCFCIGLRTATFILAAFGILSYMTNAYRFSKMGEKFGMVYSVLSTYYIGAAIACIAGLYGVIKNKVNYVRIYSIFYWWQLVLGFSVSIAFSILAFYIDKDVCQGIIENKPPDMELDLEQCMDWYKKTAAAMVVFLGITCLIDLHFCMAVWAYYQKLKVEKQYDNIPENGYIVYYTPVPAYTVSLPPSYESVPQDDFKKSHIPSDSKH